MTQVRKEIVLSARDDNVSSMMSKIRQESSELGRTIINQASQTANSAREVVEIYERQIRTLQQKQSLERKDQRIVAEKNYGSKIDELNSLQIISQAEKQRRVKEIDELSGEERESKLQELLGGTITKKEFSERRKGITDAYRGQIRDINTGSKEDQMQVDLLRELIQTVKNTSKDEIHSDTVNATRDTGMHDQAQLYGAGQEFVDLADRLKKENTGSGPGTGGQDYSGLVDAVNNIRDISSQSNVVDAARAGSTGFLGKFSPAAIVAAALAGIGMVGMQRRAGLEVSARDLAGLSGALTPSDIIDDGMGRTDEDVYGPLNLNVSREEFLGQRVIQAARASGTVDHVLDRAMQQIELERAYGLDPGTTNSLERLVRVVGGSTQYLGKQVRDIIPGDDMTRVNPMIQEFLRLQESALTQFGTTEYRGTLGLMQSLSGLGGRFEREDYLGEAVGDINRGLTQGGSPEAQAIKYDILRKVHPGKSMAELQVEMEKGINSEGYLKGVMDMIKRSSSDINTQFFLAKGILGDSVRGEDLLDILTQGKDIGEFSTLPEDPGSIRGDIRQRGLAVSSTAETQLQFAQETMQDLMQKVGDGVSKLVEAVIGLDSKVGSLENTIKDRDY